ncbi:MAG: NAD(P)-dependent oxidoreductase [Acidobacteria bacterium]|nr:NAD(P)-dependent oxidoreductase [Acidobacteriota bacterium]MCA1608668.1 NAD(P)-dependent oxidoreductase [Acidobacteriota bacterium]
MSDNFCSPLDITQIERNFADINPALNAAEALHEANRCLYCYDAPCMHACPTHIDIPGFIKKIASGNLTGSARVIFDANPIGATCARVCPVEVLCEGACVEKTLLQKPIEIGRLQRYATDFAFANRKQIFQKGESNGKSVGIVGSGPAGLSCAAYLARLGYHVAIYERKPMAGGLDTYGMAEYKMSQTVSQAEIDQIAQLGVKFVLNTAIGIQSESPADVDAAESAEARGLVRAKLQTSQQHVAFAELNEWHDAIFLAVGLGESNKLNIPGEDLNGVYDALPFIEQIKSREWKSIPLGKSVVVIGAGNTAIDAVTQAKRLGAASVKLVYRKSEKDIPAYDYEYELAKKDGIEFVWQAAPIGILSDDGNNHVSGLRCEKTDGSLQIFEIPCDMVIKAVGQTKRVSFFNSIAGIQIDEKGRVVVNDLMQSSNPKIFAGGDCVNGGAEAVDAAQMGKLAAQGIHKALSGEVVQFAGASVAAVNPSRGHTH